MSAQTEEEHRIVACLAHRVGGSPDIEVVAPAIVTMFEDMNAALVPIIGTRGVAALYRRSLLLCAAQYPSLAQPYESLVVAMDLAHFTALLSVQNPIDAMRFSERLLKTTYELLATLIGPALCARILYGVWENHLSAPPAQELLP